MTRFCGADSKITAANARGRREMEDGFVKVVSPIDDTPAFEAGVQAGDFIIEIDGVSVYGMTLGDAVDKMRGKVNTEITIKISRGELEPFDIVIVRDKIKVQSVRARREGNAAYLRITSFNEKTESGLIKNMNKRKMCYENNM